MSSEFPISTRERFSRSPEHLWRNIRNESSDPLLILIQTMESRNLGVSLRSPARYTTKIFFGLYRPVLKEYMAVYTTDSGLALLKKVTESSEFRMLNGEEGFGGIDRFLVDSSWEDVEQRTRAHALYYQKGVRFWRILASEANWIDDRLLKNHFEHKAERYAEKSKGILGNLEPFKQEEITEIIEQMLNKIVESEAN